MLILSQDKGLTTESMELSLEKIERSNKTRIMVQENCGRLYLLGIYDTKERAKEVLKDIITAYKFNINFKYNKFLTEKEVIEMQNYLVYEMPKE